MAIRLEYYYCWSFRNCGWKMDIHFQRVRRATSSKQLGRKLINTGRKVLKKRTNLIIFSVYAICVRRKIHKRTCNFNTSERVITSGLGYGCCRNLRNIQSKNTYLKRVGNAIFIIMISEGKLIGIMWKILKYRTVLIVCSVYTRLI